MLPQLMETRQLGATLILSLEDAFGRAMAGPLSHPRPFEPLQFHLRAADIAGARQDFQPPLALEVIRTASGYHLWHGLHRVAGGGTRRLPLAQGLYTIRASSPMYQPLDMQVALPMPDVGGRPAANALGGYSFAMQAGYAYPFPDAYPLRPEPGAPCVDTTRGRRGPTLLRGALHTPGGGPIVGARVQVAGLSNEYVTDETGEWVLWFASPPLAGAQTVAITLPDGAQTSVAGACVIPGRELRLVETGVRGWVQRGGRAVPGATITVSGWPGAALTRGDGSWAYFFGFDAGDLVVDITATLPGLPGITQSAVPVRSRATTAVPTFNFPV